MSRELKGGIVGCGFFARHHFEAWHRIPDVQIVAACDRDIDRARAFAGRVYRNPADMFGQEELDFVDIVTRADSHLELVTLAAEQNLPMICQKPVATDWESAAQLVALTEDKAVPFMVHENWRWQPWYRAARALISGGEIGDPLSYAFRSRTQDGAGENPYPRQAYFRELPRFLIYETLIHHIDTARFLFGDIESVYAQTRRRNPHITGEDCATLIVNHQHDISGCIDGHRFLDPDPDGPAMGEAIFEGEDAFLLVLATGDLYRNQSLVWKNDIVSGYRGDSVWATQAHFIFCLKNGCPFESGGREYLKSFAVMEAAYRSAREHRKVSTSEFPA
jgi:predicted dehydrogenase